MDGEQQLFIKDDTSGDYVEYTPDPPPAFHETLPEDIRGNEHLEGVEDGAQLARYYVDLKSNYLKPPDSADGYEFEKPEGFHVSDEGMAEYKRMAFENGMNQKQFSEMMQFQSTKYNAGMKAIKDSIEAGRAESEQTLKTEWGADYEKNLEAAKSVLRHEALAGEGFQQFLNDTRFGDHPEVVKFFHKLSKAISEDTLIKSGTNTTVIQPGEIKRGEDGRPMLNFTSMKDGDK